MSDQNAISANLKAIDFGQDMQVLQDEIWVRQDFELISSIWWELGETQ